MIPPPSVSTRPDSLLPYTTLYRAERSGVRCFFEDPFGVISMLKACSTKGAHRSLRTPDGEHCHRGGADPHRSALNCRRPTRLRSRVSGSSIELSGIEPGHRISTKKQEQDEKPAFQSTVRTIGTVPDRSEERRVGKACVSTCTSRWSPYN